MIDINKQKNQIPLDRNEYFKCALIALLPAVIVIEILKGVGITGALPAMISLFGGIEVVKIIRSKRKLKDEK